MANVFHFEGDQPSFEDLGIENGTRTWHESAVMGAMGYDVRETFRKAVRRAMQACLSLGLTTEENFILAGDEYKFTRFACYLVAINGDPKKPGVAAAQAYFAALADSFQTQAEHADGVDRVLVREEITSGIKALNHTAMTHGIEDYARFQNAGYRGMYNMSLRDLEQYKQLGSKEKLLDRMGKTELAANLFRVTQTDQKIQKENITGQVRLEHAAHSVGQTVRRTIQELGGTPPERLPLAAPIGEVKKQLKGASKRFRELDGKGKKRLRAKSDPK